MKTEILSLKENTLEEIANRTKELFDKGELVAFPTETVYGLGGNGFDREAAKKIYAAKGRPSDNPLILHIAELAQLDSIVTDVPENAKKLIDAFWPGPLTIIFNKSEKVPTETCGGLNTVAVRFPSHPTANAILKKAGYPIAAPSANLSGRPSTTSFLHVYEDLYGRVSCLVDGDETPIGMESTIVDLSTGKPMLLRPGYITKEMIENVIGPVDEDPAITKDGIINHRNDALLHPKAPGMKYRHYAPKAMLTVYSGDFEKVLKTIKKEAEDKKTGILTVDEHKALYPYDNVISVGSVSSPEQIAHNLFDALRKFDRTDVEKICAEDLSEYDIGSCIMNRLLKAAGGDFRICE